MVLRPCLLIVMIAALNKEVTTNGLYHWGVYVFVLTSTLFFLVSQLLRKQRASIESPAVAIPAMLRKLIPVVPYAIVTAIIIMIYEHALETPLNEITAPTIMPIILLLVLIYDKMTNKGKAELTPDYASHRQEGVERSVRFATTEAIGHVGALMSLMTLSLAIGGIIERSEIVHLFPQVFESPWHAMAVLCVAMAVLVLILVLVVGIFFICSVLFENLKQPFFIIIIIPFSVIGLFLIFSLFDFYFDQGGYAAFVMLGGLAVNAAIFIVNDLNNRSIGLYNRNILKAVAGKAVPIMLTILSTCFGLIPFIIEGQNEVFWFSLAIGTIGGLVFSIIGVFVALPVFLWKKK